MNPTTAPSDLPTLAFIGAGNMAQAIIHGLVASGYPAANIIATGRTQTKLDELHHATHVNISPDNHRAVGQADVVILGVKPQMLGDLVQDLAPSFDVERHLLISLAAGVRGDTIVGWTGKAMPLVRCMPNTPSLVGKGASGLFPNQHVTNHQRAITEQIVNAVGISIWVDAEHLIDAVTAISGSGPAYYFLMMEAMIKAGIDLGLTEEQVNTLVKQTALGAATMVAKTSTKPAQLRANVCSPNGTTERAINSFLEDGYPATVAKAMQAAYDRSVEMGESL